MKLWLDDIRDAPDETWTVVRTACEAADMIFSYDVEVISLDHDLGDGVMTGYDLMNEIEVNAAKQWWTRVPLQFEIHSANPVGRKNMQAAIDSIERMRDARDA